VVVYRNGVGYFERAGSVDADRVTFKMRQRMVGDFLATLAIVERGGSSVRSASFPLEIEDEGGPVDPAFLRTLAALRKPDAEPPKSGDPLREVVLRMDGERHDLAVGYVAETPLWRPSYRLVIADDGKARPVDRSVTRAKAASMPSPASTLVTRRSIASGRARCMALLRRRARLHSIP
jgi:hypothetical protein